MRRSTIKNFFNSQLVDLPICFRKSKSLFTQTFEIPLVKLTNILMRSGMKSHTLRNITQSFTAFFHKMTSILTPQYATSWLVLYHALDLLTLQPNGVFKDGFPNPETEVTLKAENIALNGNIHFNYKATLNHLLFENLTTNAPIFSFYIRKVDKSVRKNSRGKSGKYTIIWKYVPSYKRMYVTMRWLLKDLKFQKLKLFSERITRVLETFLLTPNLSFLLRLRKFVHTFVFQNFKKSLLKHLKSTS